MPFFQATSAKLPLDREVVDVRSMADLPSAGPYAFTLNDVEPADLAAAQPVLDARARAAQRLAT